MTQRDSGADPRIPVLPKAIEAERREFTGGAGPLSVYVGGNGPPAIALHSINAAASAYEMRPVFERLRDRYRVYALDLPGYGFSDRSKRPYTIQLFVQAIHDLLDHMRAHGDEGPVDAFALSLSAEFLARAASERPQDVRRLVLINPTGFRKGSHKLTGPSGASREIPGFYPVFSFPLWGRGLYNLLTRKGTIRYFLERTAGSKNVDAGMVDYDYLTARQPGAEHAPFAFLSARLFSRDIRTVYEQLAVPIWVPHGTRGDFKDFSDAAWAEAKGNWTFTPYDSGALPHFERPEEFFSDLEGFLARTAPAAEPERVD